MATKDVTAALRYTPPTQQAIRRSEYLTDALKTMQASGGDIKGGWGELAAKLGATYLLSRKADKAQDALVQALRGEQQAKAAKMGAEIDGWGGAQAPPTLPPAYAPTPIAPPQVPVDSAPLPPAAKPMAQYSPDDRQALALMLYTEAANESPDGMAAAGHVALNRLNTGYGGAKSLKDVVYAKHQFEGMTSPRANVSPNDPAFQRSQQVADAILAGQLPDPTGGAVNFINPELQAQLGRQQPSWAPQGQGQRIGRHVFYGGKPQAPGAPPPQQAQNLTQPGPMQDQPFQVASNGPIPIPSAPGPVPGGTPPGGAPLPQAGAPPGVTTWRPTPQQVTLVKRLLSSSDPADVERGTAMFQKMQELAAQPVKMEATSVNGVPAFYDPTNPLGTLQSAQIPGALQNKTYTAEQLGIPAPPGTVFSVSPAGAISPVTRPTEGQQVVGGPGGYREAPVQGGSKDPTSPLNVVAGEGKLRDDYEAQLKPYTIAREGYQKVVQAAGTGTPAGDIALVFGYMKTLDPTSTVREGEQASVRNSGTIDQTVANVYNQLLTGQGSLTPAQRAQYADSARRQFEVYDRTAQGLTQRYEKLASDYGYEPGRVIRRFDAIQPYAAPKAESDGRAPDKVYQAYKSLLDGGGIDPKAPLGSQKNPFVARDAGTAQKLDTPANRGKFIVMPDGAMGVIE